MSTEFVARLQYWIDNYNHMDIERIFKDKKELKSLPVVDSLCVSRLYSALQEDGERTMEVIFDRLLGKPTQRIEQKIERKLLESHELSNEELILALEEARSKGALPKSVKLLNDGTLITDASYEEVQEPVPLPAPKPKPEKKRLTREEQIARGKERWARELAAREAAKQQAASVQDKSE